MITVVDVTKKKRGMRDFIDLPYHLYSLDKNWCPPLKIERKRFFSDKNPFMQHSSVAYFVAYEGPSPVGRVTAHIDAEYNKYYKTRQGFFGFYESIESPSVATTLLAAAENWILEQGIDSITGPCNFTTNHEVGFLTEGFNRPPMLLMPYTKSYYPDLFYSLGYKKEKELLAYWLGDVPRTPKNVTESARKISEKLKGTIDIRHIDMKNLKSELKIVLDIYNEAWSKNWGFVPMTDAEISETASELKLFVNPNLTFILYKDRTPAAVLLALPDIHQVLMKIRDGKLLPFGIFKLLFERKNISRMRV
ncbi:MAG: hypothetical protein ACE5FU_04115, partial [Nitrospinota bacterium]